MAIIEIFGLINSISIPFVVLLNHLDMTQNIVKKNIQKHISSSDWLLTLVFSQAQ
jgi:hypothetical protein